MFPDADSNQPLFWFLEQLLKNPEDLLFYETSSALCSYYSRNTGLLEVPESSWEVFSNVYL